MDIRTLVKATRYGVDDKYRKEQNEKGKEGCGGCLLAVIIVPLIIWGIVKYYGFIYSLPIFSGILQVDISESFIATILFGIIIIGLPIAILFTVIAIGSVLISKCLKK